MKKLFAFLFAVVCLFAFAACSGDPTFSGNFKTEANETEVTAFMDKIEGNFNLEDLSSVEKITLNLSANVDVPASNVQMKIDKFELNIEPTATSIKANGQIKASMTGPSKTDETKTTTLSIDGKIYLDYNLILGGYFYFDGTISAPEFIGEALSGKYKISIPGGMLNPDDLIDMTENVPLPGDLDDILKSISEESGLTEILTESGVKVFIDGTKMKISAADMIKTSLEEQGYTNISSDAYVILAFDSEYAFEGVKLFASVSFKEDNKTSTLKFDLSMKKFTGDVTLPDASELAQYIVMPIGG